MTNPNDPAAPCDDRWSPDSSDFIPPPFPGLTKREHFAALAMQGLLANSELYATAVRSTGKGGEHFIPTHISLASVEHADALIAELNKEGK